MKNNGFIIGLLTILLVFGLMLSGCDNGTTDNGDGDDISATWRYYTNNMLYISIKWKSSEIVHPESYITEGYLKNASKDCWTVKQGETTKDFDVGTDSTSHLTLSFVTYTKPADGTTYTIQYTPPSSDADKWRGTWDQGSESYPYLDAFTVTATKN